MKTLLVKTQAEMEILLHDARTEAAVHRIELANARDANERLRLALEGERAQHAADDIALRIDISALERRVTQMRFEYDALTALYRETAREWGEEHARALRGRGAIERLKSYCRVVRAARDVVTEAVRQAAAELVELDARRERFAAALACAYALTWALRDRAPLVDAGSVDDALDTELRRLGLDPMALRFKGSRATTDSLRAMLRPSDNRAFRPPETLAQEHMRRVHGDGSECEDGCDKGVLPEGETREQQDERRATGPVDR